MRISDWSSDVCSSDLKTIKKKATAIAQNDEKPGRHDHWPNAPPPAHAPESTTGPPATKKPGPIARKTSAAIQGARENGRASCRDRECQYVKISVVAVALKTKIKIPLQPK